MSRPSTPRPGPANSQVELTPDQVARLAEQIAEGRHDVPEGLSPDRRERLLGAVRRRLSAVQFEKMRGRLHEEIHHQEDQVLFIPLCERCVVKMEAMGRGMEAVDARDVVVVV